MGCTGTPDRITGWHAGWEEISANLDTTIAL
jgi:hypothetical protein